MVKKLSIGIGEQLGEDDLNNHESKPTLQERKQRLQKEMDSLDDLLIAIEEDKMNVDLVKHKAFDSLQIMSQRLREVKTGKLVTQKKLENVQKKLNSNEDWMKSPYAPSISYYKTRILYMGNTINNLLECTDDIGYLISILNGRSDMYIRGSGSVLNLGKSPLFKGLRNVQGDTVPEITKQGSKKMAWVTKRGRCYG